VQNRVPPQDRDLAMVFQSYALYPHMTVYKNLAFGMKVRREPRSEVRPRVEEVARLLDIDGLLDRRPSELSGGQRQRVALGRALLRSPRAFLMDEPLSNLDAALRVQMRVELKHLHDRLSVTTVYVTHDQVEAMTLADRVVVMNGGKIEQIGTPNDLYHHPKTRFVAGFIGSPAMNLIPAKLEGNGSGLTIRLSDKLSFQVPESRAARYRGHIGKDLLFGLRPEHITETRGRENGVGQEFSIILDVVEPMGMETMVFFTIDGTEVCGRVEPTAAKGAGEVMALRANLDHMHLIDPATNLVL
jgi:multiple sugar transport system ATP-binding protein